VCSPPEVARGGDAGRARGFGARPDDASASASAASAPMIVRFADPSQPPVASAKTVSPSLMVCDGTIARAIPSSAISAMRFASVFVSRALVATTAMVVFWPGAGGVIAAVPRSSRRRRRGQTRCRPRARWR